MTENEALIKLNEMTFEDEAFKFTLCEALNAKIPIPVNSKGEEDFGGYSALCPKCGSVIVKIDSLGDICAVCGQALDWHGTECDDEPKTYYIKCPFEVGKNIYTVIDDGVEYPYISTETVTDISTKGVWISTGDSDMENVSHLIEWDEFGIDYFRTYKEAENKIVELTAGKNFIRKNI